MNLVISIKKLTPVSYSMWHLLQGERYVTDVGVAILICLFWTMTNLDLVLKWIVQSFLTQDLIPIIWELTGTKLFSQVYSMYYFLKWHLFQQELTSKDYYHYYWNIPLTVLVVVFIKSSVTLQLSCHLVVISVKLGTWHKRRHSSFEGGHSWEDVYCINKK